MDELADCLKEGQAFDVADCAADLAEHEIHFISADAEEVFDFIGNMWDDLDGFPQVITAALFFEHVGIDPA